MLSHLEKNRKARLEREERELSPELLHVKALGMLERGVKSEFKKALSYLARSRSSHPDSDFILSVLEKNGQHSNTGCFDVIASFEKEGSDPRAIFICGVLYQTESYNDTKYTAEQKKEFLTKSVDRFIVAADMGYRFAEEAVGGHYFSTNNTELAKLWYRKAAEQNLGRSQYRIGRLSDDDKEIASFYEASVANGSMDAFDKLAKIYFTGTGTEKDLKKSILFAGKAIAKESFFFESSKLFSEELIKDVESFWKGENVDLNLIFEIGKCWYWYIYKSWCEREQLSVEAKKAFYRTMELYCVWCQRAQVAALYSIWMADGAGLSKDVGRVIGRHVWESRDQPGAAGWYRPMEDLGEEPPSKTRKIAAK